MITVEDIKNSLRIDHVFDDGMISTYIETAKQYIVFAIDREANIGDLITYPQFDLAISLLAQHWYLNRQEASSERIPVTVQSLLQQLRGVYYATH